MRRPSIGFLELYTLTASLQIWGQNEKLVNTRVAIFCDNESVLHMVNKLSSSCVQCMKLIRMITLDNLHFNRKVHILHVRSEKNVLADSLSHIDFKHFWRHALDTMNELPKKLPENIWPIQKVWFS